MFSPRVSVICSPGFLWWRGRYSWKRSRWRGTLTIIPPASVAVIIHSPPETYLKHANAKESKRFAEPGKQIIEKLRIDIIMATLQSWDC